MDVLPVGFPMLKMLDLSGIPKPVSGCGNRGEMLWGTTFALDGKIESGSEACWQKQKARLKERLAKGQLIDSRRKRRDVKLHVALLASFW